MNENLDDKQDDKQDDKNVYIIESIEESNFSNGGIENIQDLENLYENPPKITNINISNKIIEVIPQSFCKFVNLKYLDLSHNHLTNIDYLKGCTKIETLKLSNNEIKLTSSLVFLKALQSLDLSYNKIIITEVFIKNFRVNSELLSLKLEGNLRYNFEDVKNYCLENLGKLLYLDSYKISNSKHKKYQDIYINIQLSDGQNKKFKKLSEYIKLKKSAIGSNLETVETRTETKTEKLITEIKSEDKNNKVLEKLRKENEALKKKNKKVVSPKVNLNHKNKQRPLSQFKGKAALYNFLYLDINYQIPQPIDQIPQPIVRDNSNDNAENVESIQYNNLTRVVPNNKDIKGKI